jgi:F-type H+-transporting ATPase subunit gamma
MTQHRQTQAKVTLLRDINELLKAIKNIALMEVNKAGKGVILQKRRTDSIQETITDFLRAYPKSLPVTRNRLTFYILLGSERGICGNFNELVYERLPRSRTDNTHLIVIGQQLVNKFANQERCHLLPGANVFEDIPQVINAVLAIMQRVYQQQGYSHPQSWTIIHNSDNNPGNELQTQIYQPFSLTNASSDGASHAKPLIHLSPDQLLLELLNQFLASVFYTVVYESFLAENRQRLHHIESALNQLDKRLQRLKHRLNTFRQEEITEELEVLLTSVKSLTQGGSVLK